MSKFVRHYVNDMDETLVQSCIFCGEVIEDYNGAMVPKGSPMPKGWAAGYVYVKPGNPTELQTAEPEEFEICNPKK